MIKRLMTFLVAFMLCFLLGITTLNADTSNAIIIDFEIEPTYTEVATDAEKGNNWNIAWEDGLSFLGKYNLTRVSYSYDKEEKAAVFTAHTQTGVLDPYFVAADAGTNNAADMPEKYQIDTSVYKVIKVLYKANSQTANTAAFHWISTNVPAYDDYNSYLYDIEATNEWVELTLDLTDNPTWENAGVITQLRIGAFRGSNISDKDTMAYRYIGFFKTKADADKFSRVESTPVPEKTPDPNAPKDKDGKDNNVMIIVIVAVIAIIAILAIVIIVAKKKRK